MKQRQNHSSISTGGLLSLSTIGAFALLFFALGAPTVAQDEGGFTPIGAIQAANADGSIPAWEGGVTKPPASYVAGGHHPDPFAEDEPIYRITAADIGKYADMLSPGQVSMLKRYPSSWYLEVYPSRRSASYPADIYRAAEENAASASLTADGNGVQNCRRTSPFPAPENGLQAIWNHMLRYRGESILRSIGQAAPTPSGSYTMVRIDEKAMWVYNRKGTTSETSGNRLANFWQKVAAPARLAGTLLLVHETLDQGADPRIAWVYNAGQRRVRRAPHIAYDNPGTAADGQRTTDQFDMFNGSPDRYDWELIGRREMIVPYNCYKLHSDRLKHSDIIQAGHVDPSVLRYEKHRVWVVEARLKDGTNHIYARRTFFFDEDSWQAVVVDQYDGRGQIWRVSEAYTLNYYEVPMIWDTLL
ncbi:MAG TPA: DUF1329 domain-containing protein, partial [Planctomycetes bacterium]|nr:DUF1329 domain-containing protein [Planctomycetota bacterium]